MSINDKGNGHSYMISFISFYPRYNSEPEFNLPALIDTWIVK